MATFKLLNTVTKEFYWILKSDNNGKIIAKSSESYINKSGAVDSIKWVKLNAKDAQVIDETK